MGCAGMGTGGYVIVAYVVEPAKRPSYTGIIGLSYCFASVVGPLVGGAITTGSTWRWCFYMNLPIGAVRFNPTYPFPLPPIRELPLILCE